MVVLPQRFWTVPRIAGPFVAIALLFGGVATKAAEPISADLVLRGGELHDGSGDKPRSGDVALRGDQIVAVGEFDVAPGATVIDVEGMIVAPGFIDLHNHSDRSITKPKLRRNINYLTQGVTTIVTGNCGSGRSDVADYFSEIGKNGAGTNVAHLIPHGQVRRDVMKAAIDPRPEQLEAMKARVEQGMRDGAFGMSTGLIYLPGANAKTDELVQLAGVVAKFGGIYVSHMRNEGTRLLESIDETLEIGRRAKLPVHVSHFKASGPAAWGLAARAIQRISEARDDGQKVTADQYPYIASSTSLAAMVVPKKFRDKNDFKEALNDEKRKAELVRRIGESIRGRNGGESLFVAGYRSNRKWQGKNLAEVAKAEGRSVVDIVLEIQENGGAQMVSFSMNEEEVRLIMRQPFVATASDGSAKLITADTAPHPRSYGCFPRKIGHYAIDGKVMSTSQAIRSSSGLPADILGISKRGYLRPGYFADVVVLDAKQFRDTATFQKPHQYAKGVQQLFINGVRVIQDGEVQDRLAGRALRRDNQ